MEDEFIIKNGNNNRSIGSYIEHISQVLINKGKILLKAFGNNMNKLITIEEIIKRGVDNKIQITLSIGKSKINNKDTEYISANLAIDNKDKEIVDKLNVLKNNKSNKRNINVIENNGVEIDNPIAKDSINIEDKCLENLDLYF